MINNDGPNPKKLNPEQKQEKQVQNFPYKKRVKPNRLEQYFNDKGRVDHELFVAIWGNQAKVIEDLAEDLHKPESRSAEDIVDDLNAGLALIDDESHELERIFTKYYHRSLELPDGFKAGSQRVKTTLDKVASIVFQMISERFNFEIKDDKRPFLKTSAQIMNLPNFEEIELLDNVHPILCEYENANDIWIKLGEVFESDDYRLVCFNLDNLRTKDKTLSRFLKSFSPFPLSLELVKVLDHNGLLDETVRDQKVTRMLFDAVCSLDKEQIFRINNAFKKACILSDYHFNDSNNPMIKHLNNFLKIFSHIKSYKAKDMPIVDKQKTKIKKSLFQRFTYFICKSQSRDGIAWTFTKLLNALAEHPSTRKESLEELSNELKEMIKDLPSTQ